MLSQIGQSKGWINTGKSARNWLAFKKRASIWLEIHSVAMPLLYQCLYPYNCYTISILILYLEKLLTKLAVVSLHDVVIETKDIGFWFFNTYRSCQVIHCNTARINSFFYAFHSLPITTISRRYAFFIFSWLNHSFTSHSF